MTTVPTRAVVLMRLPEPGPHAGARRGALAPFFDRPFLSYVLDTVSGLGIGRVDLVFSERPGFIRSFCNDGARWGIEITHHVMRSSDSLYEILRALPGDRSDPRPVLVVVADRIPSAPSRPTKEFVSLEPLMCGGEWSGWAWVDPGHLPMLAKAGNHHDLELLVRYMPGAASVDAGELVDARSPEVLRKSYSLVLGGGCSTIVLDGREVEPGIWLNRGGRIHGTARLIPPVWIGAWAKVEAGAVVGPETAVCRGSVVGRCAHASRSVILPNTILNRNGDLFEHLLNGSLRLHTSDGHHQRDETKYAWIHDPAGSRIFAGFCYRVGAALLFLLSIPVTMAVVLSRMIRGRTVAFRIATAGDGNGGSTVAVDFWSLLPRRQAYRAPVSRADSWRLLFLHVAPGLLAVALGRIRVCGVTPRTRSEQDGLPGPWPRATSGPAGLITLGVADGLTDPEVGLVSDALAALHTGLRQDFSAVARIVLRGLRP